MSQRRIDRTRDKTDRGQLPEPMHFGAAMAPSDDKTCDGCDEVVEPVEQVYYVNVGRVLLLRFHDTCYGAWSTFKR